MLTALWIVVIIEEVDGKLRCVLIHFFGQGTDILAYSPTIFHRTLAADFIKDSHTLFVSLRVAYTLTAGVVFLVFYGLAQQTPSVPMSTVQQATHYVRGRVVEVTDNAWQGQQDYEDIPVGKQTVRVELRSGKYRGQVYELPNQLSYLYGTILKAGDAVTVAVTVTNNKA